MVIFLELCEARKNIEKIKQKEDLHFSLLAIAVPVLGLIKKASLNGCYWISFLGWEWRSSWFFSTVVHDCDNAEESIGKTTHFHEGFPWRYLNTGPAQGKKELHCRSWSKKLIQKQPFKLAFLMKPETGTANRSKLRFSFCFIFSIFSWPHTIQGKLLKDQFFTSFRMV